MSQSSVTLIIAAAAAAESNMHSRMSREICFPATTVAAQKDAPGMMIENDEATTKTHSGVQLAHTIFDKACVSEGKRAPIIRFYCAT